MAALISWLTSEELGCTAMVLGADVGFVSRNRLIDRTSLMPSWGRRSEKGTQTWSGRLCRLRVVGRACAWLAVVVQSPQEKEDKSMSATLTKDADKLLVLMYRRFLEAKKSGMSRANAKHMGGSDQIRELLLPANSREDVDELCFELSDAGYLDCAPGDDTIYDSKLTNAAIVLLENRFKDGIIGVLEFLSKFIP